MKRESGRVGGKKKQLEASQSLASLFEGGEGAHYRKVIRLWRMSLGLNRKEFAAYVGTPEPTVKSLEEGIKLPNTKTVEDILAKSPYRLRVIPIN